MAEQDTPVKSVRGAGMDYIKHINVSSHHAGLEITPIQDSPL